MLRKIFGIGRDKSSHSTSPTRIEGTGESLSHSFINVVDSRHVTKKIRLWLRSLFAGIHKHIASTYTPPATF